jgi:hypothetical protein
MKGGGHVLIMVRKWPEDELEFEIREESEYEVF